MAKIEPAPGKHPYPMPCSLVGADSSGKPNDLTVSCFVRPIPNHLMPWWHRALSAAKPQRRYAGPGPDIGPARELGKCWKTFKN